MECFKFNEEVGLFEHVTTLDYKDMVSACVLTTLRMLVSQSIYGKISLHEWDEGKNAYNML